MVEHLSRSALIWLLEKLPFVGEVPFIANVFVLHKMLLLFYNNC